MRLDKIPSQRKINNGIFFPGLGNFKTSSLSSASIARPAREVQASNTTGDTDLSPVSMTVSDNAPPALLPTNGKCQFVQQMNSSLGEECTKGGMRF